MGNRIDNNYILAYNIDKDNFIKQFNFLFCYLFHDKSFRINSIGRKEQIATFLLAYAVNLCMKESKLNF